MLKKSYKGFWIFMALYVLSMFSCVLLPESWGGFTIGRIILNMCTLGIALLSWIIYRADRVYWYNGITYEEAEAAGPQRRSACAREHAKRFGIAAGLFLVFSVFAQLFQIPFYNDVWLAIVALVGTAVSTIGIKL